MMRPSVVIRCREGIKIYLVDGRWVVPGHPRLAPMINHVAGLGRFSPADGHPVLAAAQQVAQLLGGKIKILRPVEHQSDRVY